MPPSPICAFMSSSDRLSWLALEVWNGRSASVSFSFNVSNGREKVKFVLDDVYVQSAIYRPALLSAISAVQVAMESSIVIDKGHKSKSHKQTVIEFWSEQLPACSANILSIPISNPEPLPLDAANSVPRNNDCTAAAVPSPAEVSIAEDHQDHATDLARYAELEMQLAACDGKVENYKKKFQVLADCEEKHGSEHPSVRSSTIRMYSEVHANAVRRNEIIHEMNAISVKRKPYDG